MNGNKWKQREEFRHTLVKRQCRKGWSGSSLRASQSPRRQAHQWKNQKRLKTKLKASRNWKLWCLNRRVRKSSWKLQREQWRSREYHESSRENSTNGKRRKESRSSLRLSLSFILSSEQHCLRRRTSKKGAGKNLQDWNDVCQLTVWNQLLVKQKWHSRISHQVYPSMTLRTSKSRKLPTIVA